MSVAFTFWTPAKKPIGEFDLVDREDRKKIAENVFRFYKSLSGVKFIVRAIHKKYGVKRVREILRRRLRSVLCSTSHWQNDVHYALDYGEARGIVRDEDFAALGIDSRRRHMLIERWKQTRAGSISMHEFLSEQLRDKIVACFAHVPTTAPGRSNKSHLQLVYSRD